MLERNQHTRPKGLWLLSYTVTSHHHGQKTETIQWCVKSEVALQHILSFSPSLGKDTKMDECQGTIKSPGVLLLACRGCGDGAVEEDQWALRGVVNWNRDGEVEDCATLGQRGAAGL